MSRLKSPLNNSIIKRTDATNLSDQENYEESLFPREIEIIEKEVDILPKTKVTCDKCGNKEAHYWTIQTRAGDEPETKFLRCTKCKYTWRDYD